MKPTPSFAELLGVAETESRAPDPTTLTRAKKPRPGSPLTRTARRMIALAAEARGESLAPENIEGRLQRDRDKACGITNVTRRIIDRAEGTA